jgi:hypothetical protein
MNVRYRVIKISSKKMQVLNSLTRNFTLKWETLEYVTKYKRIYKRVVREAKIKDNDSYVVESENKTKTVWQLIKKLGKIQQRPKVGTKDSF